MAFIVNLFYILHNIFIKISLLCNMQLKNKLVLTGVLFFLSFSLFSQVKVGQWVDHLSYNYANSVAKVDGIVYVSNGSGLATYNVNDNSIEKLTKIDGLSDIGVKLLRKNDYNNCLLVVYENTNIDVIKPDKSIINISDIKRKIIPGKKNINEIYFSGSLAYISCGFGIVIFDTEKLEIKDTYYLGNGIINLEIYQVTKNDTAVFAATPTGIYYGSISKNLSNYQNWKPLNTGLPSGPYNSIINLNGKIITNYSEKLKSNTSLKDTLYNYTSSGWIKYSINGNCTGAVNKKLYDYSKYGKLLILDQYGVAEYTSNGTRLNYLTNYGFDNAQINAQINDIFYENNNNFWVADNRYGLIKSGGSQWSPNEKITINGPTNNYVNDIDMKDGTLIVAPVYLGDTYANQYLYIKPNIYKDKEWTSFSAALPDTIRDINCAAIDPNDNTHFVFGCMDHGISELKNNQFFNYNTSTPSLASANAGFGIFVSGISFDKNSNIWAGLQLGKKAINVLKKGSSTWTSLNFEQFIVQQVVSKIIFDKYDQAWILLPRGIGLMIYKDVNGLAQPNSSNTKLLSLAERNGKLPSLDVRSICEDKDGKIWIGTGKGVSVFYNPENVFTGANWDSQQILIEQDGHVQILLESDIITAIAVDGVNRKWIGTESSGVYCLSPDGQKEIYHFTKENSPLYSNLIKDIVTDETTGDVFIATDKGIESYRTSIIKGFDDFTNVHAFPNPIRPGFSGPVYITGLIDEAEVKITDVSGNLVWSAKSQGGQIEWNLQTFSGTKATSGTYLIYCASANGDKYATSKLLIIN